MPVKTDIRQRRISYRKSKWKKRSLAAADPASFIALGERLLYDAVGAGCDVLVTQDIEIHLGVLEAWATTGMLRREAPPP